MELCLVFTPDNPNLYALSATAWLIFELAAGRAPGDLEDAYHTIVEPLVSPDEAREQVARTVEDLCGKGILKWTCPVPEATVTSGAGGET